jgi:hypothetical protein
MIVTARPQERRRPASVDRQLRYLKRIFKRHSSGYLFVAARHVFNGKWIERSFEAGDWVGMREFLTAHSADKYDLYFCPNVFGKPRRLARYAKPTPFAWCDADEADPLDFRPQPTIAIETSTGRYQAIWEFERAVSASRAEAVSRHLTNTFDGDRGGWSITKML